MSRVVYSERGGDDVWRHDAEETVAILILKYIYAIGLLIARIGCMRERAS